MKKIKFTFLEKVQIKIAGREKETLALTTPSEVNYVKMEAKLILIPTIIAFVFGFIGFYAVSENYFYACAGAVLLSGLVLAIDRAMIAYTRKVSKLIIAQRLVLAFSLSYAVSTIGMLGPTKGIIAEQQNQEARMYRDSINLHYDDQITTLQDSIAKSERVMNTFEQAFLDEGLGVTGTGKRGFGEAAQHQQNRFKSARLRFDSLRMLNGTLINKLNLQREEDLKSYAANQANDFFGQLKSLHAIEEPRVHHTLKFFHFLLLLLDLIPLFLKLTKKKRMDLYYKIQDLRDKQVLDYAKLISAAEVAKMKTERELHIKKELIMTSVKIHRELATMKSNDSLNEIHDIINVIELQNWLEELIDDDKMNELIDNTLSKTQNNQKDETHN